MQKWLKALISQASITTWTIVSVVSTLATFFPSLPHELRPATFVVALISFAWANYKVFQKVQAANDILREALAQHDARVSNLVIVADRGSRYTLQPLDNIPRADFRGGYFEFYLMIENTGKRNSTITNYQVDIQELNRAFPNLTPVENLPMIRGRRAMMGVNQAHILSTTGIIEIPSESTTHRGTLLFHLQGISLEDFVTAGLRMEGPERRFGPLHCRLTITDRSGTSASHDFVLTEE
jgi:hypothetical protein